MTHRNLFHNITLTAGAALIGLASVGAQAHDVTAGNYQTHVLPSTTRHTANNDHAPVDRDYNRVAEDNSAVQAGNYQTHVLPHTTRRTASEASNNGRFTFTPNREVTLTNSYDR